MNRTVKQVLDTPNVMMGNIEIGQPIPSPKLEQIDPFILLHHADPVKVEPGKPPMDIGPHPHRGFEPVSFVFQGYVEHKDSEGNHKVVGPGGVQWMTAGRGIVHSEGTPADYYDEGGYFEMIQLWINLPSALKMSEPKYQPATREDIPFLEENGARVNVIAGDYKDISGPVVSATDVHAFTIEMEPGGAVSFEVPQERNVLLFQLHGDTLVNEKAVGHRQIVAFDNDGETIRIQANEDSLILFLTGLPINEPMVSHGPFVMNSTTEIMEAMRDYSMGKMGVM